MTIAATGSTLTSSRALMSGSSLYFSFSGPKNTRWSIHSTYAAPRMIPIALTMVTVRYTLNAPTKTRASPTKPLRPGRPSAANNASEKTLV